MNLKGCLRKHKWSILLSNIVVTFVTILFILKLRRQPQQQPSKYVFLEKRNLIALKENAILVSFITDIEYPQILKSIQSVTENFNRNYNYEWLFISHSRIPADLQRSINHISRTNTFFVTLNRTSTLYGYPENIDLKKVDSVMKSTKKKIDSDTKAIDSSHWNHFMVHNFYKLEILRSYRYYMRIPLNGDFKLLCELSYDPFERFRQQNSKYGISSVFPIQENSNEGLVDAVLEYISLGANLHENNNLNTLKTSSFSSVFEIGDLYFFRSNDYVNFVMFMLSKNGVYYSSWQESYIKTMAIALFLDKFSDTTFLDIPFSYLSPPDNIYQCPTDGSFFLSNKCNCNPTLPENGLSMESYLLNYLRSVSQEGNSGEFLSPPSIKSPNLEFFTYEKDASPDFDDNEIDPADYDELVPEDESK